MAKSFAAYNARQGDDNNILGPDTMVQFFINPKDTMDTTDESIRNENI